VRINLNADMGEGYGAYDIGADAELLEIVTSANIACGMHGGDPGIMRRTARMAAERGVSIGAHPGFADLQGFGRRRIAMDAAALEDLVAYQIGAMAAMAAAAGARVTHVKAHGALNNMACVDEAYALAVARAIKAVDAALIHLVMPGTEMERATERLGLPLAREAFADRSYEADGTLTPRGAEGAVIRDPEAAAARVVEMVRDGVIRARGGEALALRFDSLCVHGDEPTAVAVARAARAALEAEGARLVTLPEMLAG
jgi:UPF0271 protein